MIEATATTEIGETDFRTEIRIRHHRLIGDEPLEKGGADLGPTPYEQVLGSLGTCTAVTLRMYAKHKGWPLLGVVVDLVLDIGGPQPSIERRVRLVGPLDAAQRERMLRIANACPIHKLLTGGAAVTTELEA